MSSSVSLCHALHGLWTGTIRLTSHTVVTAFHASPNHSFNKESLIRLLCRNVPIFLSYNSDKRISVGFIGFSNVVKNGVIHTLMSGKVSYQMKQKVSNFVRRSDLMSNDTKQNIRSGNTSHSLFSFLMHSHHVLTCVKQIRDWA